MDVEIETFRCMKVYVEVILSYLPACTNKVSTCRGLLTKTKLDGSTKCKAMLVARGFRDLEKKNISCDTPTASSSTQGLALQLLAEKQ